MADLVVELDRRYPTARRHYRQFRNRRGRDGLPSWPDWCYVPLAGAIAVISDGAPGGATTDQALEIGRVGALMAWRVKRGVWPVSPILYDALRERPLPESAPVAPLYRLPEPCVYLELPGETFVRGSFAHLEYDVNTRRPELRLLLDTDGSWDGLSPIAFFLDETLLSDVRRGTLPAAVAEEIAAFDDGLTTRVLGAVLHLCTHDTALEHRP